jgi:hypothetical protein
MLNRCANPNCTRQFKYLNGRLFRFNTLAGNGPAIPNNSGQIKWFWLCNECSDSLSLRWDRERQQLKIIPNAAKAA